jgi:hypothetical protein
MGKNPQTEAWIDKVTAAGRYASRKLILPAGVGPVRGKLVDLEGRPLANVAIKIESIERVDLKLLNEAFAAKSKELRNQAVNAKSYGGFMSGADWQLIFPPVKTDEHGEFILKGMGRDQKVEVTLSHERVSADRLNIVAAEMEANRLPHHQFFPNGTQDVYFGTRFTYAVGPAVPVVGTVTEFQSGKPIAGAAISIERLFLTKGANNSQLRVDTWHIRTVTDESGHYRLIGVPLGGIHSIQVRPPLTEPWLTAAQEFSIEPTQTSATVDVKVYRGKWIDVKVSDADTNEPIRGNVEYMALRSNPNIPQTFGLREAFVSQRFPMIQPGGFRVVGLPGPGVLLVRAYGDKVYPRKVGAEQVDGYNAERSSIPTTPGGGSVLDWNRIQQINPSLDATNLSFEITLAAGRSVKGKLVRPDGASKESILAWGLVDKSGTNSSVSGNDFTITNYEPNVPREIAFLTRDKLHVGYLRLEGEPPADIAVLLQSSVTVRGRLIDAETGDEGAQYRLTCDSTNLGRFQLFETTDAKGRFEIKGFLAGNVYSVDCISSRGIRNGKNRFTIDLSNAKPGDAVELGDVPGKNANVKNP